MYVYVVFRPPKNYFLIFPFKFKCVNVFGPHLTYFSSLFAGEHSGQSLKWVGGVDQSFAQGGLMLENNEIVIPEDGLYFVYSQVSYETLCSKDVEGDGQKYLSHSINRYTDAVGKKMPLQNSAHSVCPSLNDKKTYSTIYLGAVFNLLEGDRLSTKTSRVGDIEENYAKTFFGVFAL